ncbi:MAG: DUF211 domain-containing protein [Thaumarchaeota archaeon]|nr:DUF211 domain-containing protein [Nitrososphaerota archaeon]
MNVAIRRLVIDYLKPRETAIIDLSKALADVSGVEHVDIIATEVDTRTETVRLTIRVADINYDSVTAVLERHGTSIRSVDEISVAKHKLSSSKQHIDVMHANRSSPYQQKVCVRNAREI